MDKYVPNPSKRSPLHLEMYAFMGKLLGVAMRTKAALPFHLPSMVYKKTLGHAVRPVDLECINLSQIDLPPYNLVWN